MQPQAAGGSNRALGKAQDQRVVSRANERVVDKDAVRSRRRPGGRPLHPAERRDGRPHDDVRSHDHRASRSRPRRTLRQRRARLPHACRLRGEEQSFGRRRPVLRVVDRRRSVLAATTTTSCSIARLALPASSWRLLSSTPRAAGSWRCRRPSRDSRSTPATSSTAPCPARAGRRIGRAQLSRSRRNTHFRALTTDEVVRHHRR